MPDRLKRVQTIIKQSIEESVGFVANARQNKHNDEELSQLSKRQRNIRVKMQSTKENNKRDSLKIERNRILHPIGKKANSSSSSAFDCLHQVFSPVDVTN